MELVVFVVSLVMLCLLAARFGVDSRPGLDSREQDLFIRVHRQDRPF